MAGRRLVSVCDPAILGHKIVSITQPNADLVAWVKTAAAHGLSGGESVVISGTGVYDGTFTVTYDTQTQFDLGPDSYVSDVTTGNWQRS